jgi:3-hydroxybutyrate dehydrogenase
MRSLATLARAERRSEDECLADILSAQVFEGLMEPDDMASTYLFLASGHAANVTGQALNVDRGELMA